MFHNKGTEVRVVVHGNDFTFSGTKVELDRMRRKIEELYDINDIGTMGGGEGEIKEVTILSIYVFVGLKASSRTNIFRFSITVWPTGRNLTRRPRYGRILRWLPPHRRCGVRAGWCTALGCGLVTAVPPPPPPPLLPLDRRCCCMSF